MQNKNKLKIDGYIKHQNMRLKEMRLDVQLKILCVIVPLAILMTVLWGIMSINPPPEKWEQKQITFSNISREKTFRRSSYVLNTIDGEKYILDVGTDEKELLSQQLVPYQEYSIIYCENAFTKITQSLSSPDNEFIKLDKSVAEWENDQKIFHIICVVMICLMLIGSTISYVFWCKEERREIKKIKSKISTRLGKKEKKNQKPLDNFRGV